jgi:hypothetical protein
LKAGVAERSEDLLQDNCNAGQLSADLMGELSFYNQTLKHFNKEGKVISRSNGYREKISDSNRVRMPEAAGLLGVVDVCRRSLHMESNHAILGWQRQDIRSELIVERTDRV